MVEFGHRDGVEDDVDEQQARDRIPDRVVEPDDAGDEPARKERLVEDVPPRSVETRFRELCPRGHRRRREHVRVGEDERAEGRPEDVADEDDRPDAGHQRQAREPCQHERYGRQGVLGVELIAPEDDVHEADGIEQRAEQRVVRKLGAPHRVREEGEHDGEAGRQPAEQQFAGSGRDLLVGAGDDALEDLLGGEAVAGRPAGRGCTRFGVAGRFAYHCLVGRVVAHTDGCGDDSDRGKTLSQAIAGVGT